MSAWTRVSSTEELRDYGSGRHGHIWYSTVRDDGNAKQTPMTAPVWRWALCAADGTVVARGKHFDPVDAQDNCDHAAFAGKRAARRLAAVEAVL